MYLYACTPFSGASHTLPVFWPITNRVSLLWTKAAGQVHGYFMPPNPNFHPIHLKQTIMSSQEKCMLEKLSLTKHKRKKISGTTNLLHLLQKQQDDQMQWCTAYSVAALRASHLHYIYSALRYWAATETQSKTHRMRSMHGDLFVPHWETKPNLYAAQTPGLSLAGHSSQTKYWLLFTVRLDSHCSAEKPPPAAAAIPVRDAARRAADCAHCSAGRPGGSLPGPGSGRGRKGAESADRWSAISQLRQLSGTAGPRSRNDRPSGRPPSPPPLSAGLPGRGAAIRAPEEPVGPARPAQRR